MSITQFIFLKKLFLNLAHSFLQLHANAQGLEIVEINNEAYFSSNTHLKFWIQSFIHPQNIQKSNI